MRLDDYERKPLGMVNYLNNYGWHFSKKMYEWAVSMMKDRNGNIQQFIDKQTFDLICLKYGMVINAKGFDALYVYSMAKSDFLGSSISNELLLCKYVNDYITDKDGYDEIAFTRFYADCIANGIPILWSEMI